MKTRPHFSGYVFFFLLALHLTACGGGELVVLLPDEDGRVGQVSVDRDGNRVLLDSAYESAELDTWGMPRQGTMPEEEVRRVFSGAMSVQPPDSEVFVFHYDLGSPDIPSEYEPLLRALLAEVAAREAVEVQVTGHTDRVGTVEKNDRLSMERARHIRDALVKSGLKASFIRVVGRGEREPLIVTEDDVPEPRNRRVEVIVR